MTFSYGYRLIDGRMVLGSGETGGCFVPQVSEMQPQGHWVMPDGSLQVGPPKRMYFHVGPISILIARALRGERWVSYQDEPKKLGWV